MPDLVSVYETVGGKQLIAQAVQRTSTLLPSDDDGWNKTWTSGVTDAFRETLLKYAPMIVNAQQEAELARDTEQIELGTKYIMAENSLPIEWFEFACDQAAQIRNLLPLNRDMTSGDGDAVTFRHMHGVLAR